MRGEWKLFWRHLASKSVDLAVFALFWALLATKTTPNPVLLWVLAAYIVARFLHIAAALVGAFFITHPPKGK